MKPFLQKIGDRLLDKFSNNMHNVILVLPSKRSELFLKHYISKAVDGSIFLPKFYTIEEFLESVSGLHILDNISLTFRLYNSYLKTPSLKNINFEDFLNWSNLILYDFNDIERSLVNSKDIYTNLKNVKELDSWGVKDWSFSNDSTSDSQKKFINFYESLYALHTNFNHSLLAEGVAYQGLSYRIASEKVYKSKFSDKKIWFVGLNALTKSEESVINYFKEKNIARIFWDADVFYFQNKLHEAGSFLREQRKRWSDIDFKWVGDFFSKEKEKFQIIACPNNISQARATAQIISDFSHHDLKNSNTAIILSDESLLLPVLNNLPESVKQLNVTMGNPLIKSSLFDFLDLVITMQTNSLDYKNRNFYYKDVINLIEHPYFIKLNKQEFCVEFKKYITKNNIIHINTDDFSNLNFSQTSTNFLFYFWKDISDGINCFEDLFLSLEKILIDRNAIYESEIVKAFSKNIFILKELIEDFNFDIKLKTFRQIFKQLLFNEVTPFKGEPLKGVQLMGLLETRTLDFKNIIVLSVNEGVLPKAKSMDSLIPYDLRRYYNLPTYSERDALFAYHFYRLIQRASNISLLYNSEMKNFNSGEKSRYITQLLSEYQSSEMEHLVYKGEGFDSISPSRLIIKNVGLESKIKQWALNGVSPSAISKYINCPISFYYYYLANIRVEETLNEYADASSVGSIIHSTLDQFYNLGVLEKKHLIENKSLILNEIEKQFKNQFSKDNNIKGKNYLLLEATKKLVSDFLNLELKLLNKSNMDKVIVEILAKEKELNYNLLIDEINFNIKGLVDRIDRVGDLYRIIDYKTGLVQSSDLVFDDFNDLIKNPKKNKSLQLLIYSYLYLKSNPNTLKQQVVAGNFSFRNIKEEFIVVSKRISSRDIRPLNINQQNLIEIENILKSILKSIIYDDFQQTEDFSRCEWCEYKQICKR